MPQQFDIFKTGRDGEPIWLETSETLKLAMVRVTALRESALCEYIILSESTGKRIVFTAQGGIRRD